MAARTTWLAAALAAALIGGCATACGTAATTTGARQAPTDDATAATSRSEPTSSTTAAETTPATTSAAPVRTTASASTSRPAVPHFATPEAAMRYLATAYNTHDEVALAHVTTPDGRAALEGMRSEAVDLRLVSCTANPGGDFDCQFDHDFAPGHTPEPGSPPPPDGSHAGWAVFTVAPATGPGWYMTVLQHCD